VVFALVVFVLGSNSTTKSQSTSTLTPEELQAYEKAQTVIDWTPKEIRRQKELKNLQPAANQSGLAKILEQVGARVAAFIDNFPNITATESIQWKVDTPGFPASYAAQFRYLVVRSTAGREETFDEYRTDLKGSAIDYNSYDGTSLLTRGFTLSLLLFDPHNQATCRYRYFGRQVLGGKDADVVGFAQIPEKNLHLANFSDGVRTVPIFFQGLAWIDARTYEILRMQTDLVAPPPGKKLLRETTQIEYAPVHLPEVSTALVLPHKVIVDVWQNSVTERMPTLSPGPTHSVHREAVSDGTGSGQTTLHCRNIHTYSDYKLFRVNSRIGPAS
jgi:hypothetical protein